MPAPSLRRVAGRTRSPNADKIGPWFRELRQALGPDVKAADIGRRMGVETPTTPDAGRVLWTKLETGKNQASTADVQEAIARALSVEPGDVQALMRGDLAQDDLPLVLHAHQRRVATAKGQDAEAIEAHRGLRHRANRRVFRESKGVPHTVRVGHCLRLVAVHLATVTAP